MLLMLHACQCCAVQEVHCLAHVHLTSTCSRLQLRVAPHAHSPGWHMFLLLLLLSLYMHQLLLSSFRPIQGAACRVLYYYLPTYSTLQAAPWASLKELRNIWRIISRIVILGASRSCVSTHNLCSKFIRQTVGTHSACHSLCACTLTSCPDTPEAQSQTCFCECGRQALTGKRLYPPQHQYTAPS